MGKYVSPANRRNRSLAKAQVRQFIEDRIVRVSPVNDRGNRNPDGIIYADAAYAAYRAWYAANLADDPEWDELTLTMFGRTFSLFARKAHMARGSEYRGVGLRD